MTSWEHFGGSGTFAKDEALFDRYKARIPEFQYSRSRNWIVAHKATCAHLWHSCSKALEKRRMRACIY